MEHFSGVSSNGENILTYFWMGDYAIVIEQDPNMNFIKESVYHG